MSADPMERLTAALEGRYTLERKLGEGGMATVYLAHDEKHDREVALKVLRPELAAVVGAERFLAEIKTTARLQHPNILPLFDSGEADSFLYYVMPFVEGESLRDRLDRERQLPVDEAVRLTVDLAEALDYAHNQGVIHRDIKPANILMQQGRPVIADFGIALAVGAAGGARLTETGLSVGTPYYMSPEQATGDQHVGPSSDTYALGCVLYEMLVGEPPYPGATAQAVLGKIIAGAPVSATQQRASIPLNVDAAIRRCLEKLPADRFATSADLARALHDPSFRHGREVAGATPAGPWKAVALVAGGALVMALGFIGWSLTRPEKSPGILRYLLEAPVARGSVTIFGSQIAISPDGREIAWVGSEAGDRAPSIFLRDRDQVDPRRVPGTEGASQPFFSPAGDRIGFISENRAITVVSLGGAPPLTLVSSGVVRGGASWGDDGYIYFASAGSEKQPAGLRRIPDTGGPVEGVTAVDTTRKEVRHYFPDVLPGSKLAVVTIAREGNYNAEKRDVGVVDLKTGQVTVLLAGAEGVWSPSGHILVVRPDGALLAAPFDPESRKAGPAVPILEGVQLESQGTADLAISRNGTLVYVPGGIEDRSNYQVVWVDRSGNATPVEPDWRGTYIRPRISPDGRHLALERLDNGNPQIWIKALGGPETKLTFEGTFNSDPAWTPDGRRVAFLSNAGGTRDVRIRRADAAVPAEELISGDSGRVDDVTFSPDGKWILWVSGGNILGRRTSGDMRVVPLLMGDSTEENPQVSPDGRWIAYQSDESGEFQVYVRPFPDVNSGKWQVSMTPAGGARWGPDGKEIFYETVNQDFMVAELAIGSTFAVRQQRALFPWRGFLVSRPVPQYDVSGDGSRFIMVRIASIAAGGRLMVVENFFDELRSRTKR